MVETALRRRRNLRPGVSQQVERATRFWGEGKSTVTTKKTQDDYRKLAAHFYEQRRLSEEERTPKKITDALKGCAHEYRPAYWRRLRNALEFDQRDKSFDKAADLIAGTRNQMTTDISGRGLINPNDRLPTAPKQRRAKSISPDDRATLWKAAKALDDRDETCAAILLAEKLGVRPIEMLSLRVDLERGVVHVIGAKKAGGLRGADRVLTLPDDLKIRKNISEATRIVQRAEREKLGAVHRIQSRLDRLSRKLWPRRKARPSLYTFRHQMGGNLKAMRLDRRTIAYIMGHQSTKSVEVYGDRRSGSSGGIGIKLDGQEAERFQGRENHRAPHEVKPAVAPAAPVQQKESEPSAPYTPSSGGPSSPGM